MCLNYETNKMIPKGFEAKLEGDTTNNGKFAKAAPAASSSRQWSGFRNPRIVRVSRAFGGKDRHSKVCTIRGLRDRRIRLSVPTAIQLYDLQDRLELNQPSKVIDWLLDATKQDIDKLPPLQMLPGFGQFHQQMLLSHHEPSFNYATSPSPLPPFFGANVEAEDVAAVRTRSKEVEKGKWIKGTEQETIGDFYSGQNSSAGHRFFPLAAANNTSYSSMLPSNSMQLNSSYHNLEPSSTTLSLSQFGGQGFLPQVHENYLNHPQGATAPSSIALPSAVPHQFLFCAPSSMPPLFPMFSSNSQQYFLPNSIPGITNNSFPFRTFSSNGNQGPEQGDNRNS